MWTVFENPTPMDKESSLHLVPHSRCIICLLFTSSLDPGWKVVQKRLYPVPPSCVQAVTCLLCHYCIICLLCSRCHLLAVLLVLWPRVKRGENLVTTHQKTILLINPASSLGLGGCFLRAWSMLVFLGLWFESSDTTACSSLQEGKDTQPSPSSVGPVLVCVY